MALSTRVVDDLDSLKAVAHPLRMRLLGLLRSEGPSTASALGRALGESSGSTSYHLRQLERYGFVVDDEEQPSARERRWRAAHDMTAFPAELWDTPGGREHVVAVRRRQLDSLRRGLAAWTGAARGIGHSDYLLTLDTDDLEAMAAEIDEVVGRYAGRRGAHPVTLHVLTLPRPS
jgi:DNA-binding transcriptional ArsR family regulator